MQVLPIRTEADYTAASTRMDELLLQPNADLTASMDNRGLAQADLSRLLGSSSRAAEVLAGKRKLSKAMLRALVEAWGLDANTLIGAKRAA